MASWSWFEDVFGFPEDSVYENVRKCFRIETDNDSQEHTLITLPSRKYSASGERRFHVGRFDTPSVEELQSMLDGVQSKSDDSELTFAHVVGDVRMFHLDPTFSDGAVFQAASQFNCLEMPDPNISPEDGITDYSADRTQGPICAMACPAGTLFRNYFVNTYGQGGRDGKQLDLLSDIGKLVGNTHDVSSDSLIYWKMHNGYAMPVQKGTVSALRQRLEEMNTEIVSRSLRVGVHWDTELLQTDPLKPPGRVAQVYCSALPVAYDPTRSSPDDWAPFAQLVLQGAYDATLAVGAILAARRQQRVRVYLTKVGGGVFGNRKDWISSAIQASLNRFQKSPIDVLLVHYGRLDEDYTEVLEQRGR